MNDTPKAHRKHERRTTEDLLADLAEISRLAADLNVVSSAEDFEVGLTTDDIAPEK